MKDLFLHIERLLPEHDCIVVPGLGGFVQNETQARLVHNKEIFYPRGKEISFNSRLTFNDGILVQSYQEICGITFEEAIERMREDVCEINVLLDEGKFVRFGRIGIMHKSDEGSLQFRPDNRNLFYPESYGLSAFAYPNLEHRATVPVKAKPKRRSEDSFIHIRLSKRGFQNFLTGAAASLLIMLISKPAGNIDNIDSQKAFLLQEYFMSEPGSEGFTAGLETDEMNDASDIEDVKYVSLESINPKDQTVGKPGMTRQGVVPDTAISKVSLRTYYIIISSFPDKSNAENWLANNKKNIYSHAGIVDGNGRSRIYINQFQDKQLAESWLNKFRSDNPDHDDAWLLSVKN